MTYIIMHNRYGCCKNGEEISWSRLYKDIENNKSSYFELDLFNQNFIENDELGITIDFGLCMWVYSDKKFYLDINCPVEREWEIRNKFANFYRFFIEQRILILKVNGSSINIQSTSSNIPEKYFPLLIFDEHIFQDFFSKQMKRDSKEENIFCGNSFENEEGENSFFTEMALKVCCKMVYRGSEKSSILSQKRLKQCFERHFVNHNLMTVLLACIIYHNVKPGRLSISQTEKFDLQISKVMKEAFNYSLGIQEVCENILRHTNKRRGIIYVRILKSTKTQQDFYASIDNKNEEQYPEYYFKKVDHWLELTVIDAGEKGILETQDSYASFQNTFVWSYNIEEDITDAEAEKEIVDLIYHKGLKVFNEHIKNAQGLFYVRTVNNGRAISYARGENEQTVAEALKEVLGTQYKIWLPMYTVSDKSTEKVLWTMDISDGYRAYQDDHTEKLLMKAKHKCYERKICLDFESSPNKVVMKCKELLSFIRQDTTALYYFDFENVTLYGLKIIYFLALITIQASIKYVVLYNVNNQLFEQFLSNYQKSVERYWKSKKSRNSYFYVFNDEGTPIFVTNSFEEKKSIALRKYLWTYRGIYYDWKENEEVIPDISQEEENEVLLPVEVLGTRKEKRFSAPIFEKHMDILFKNEMSDNNKFGLLYTGHVNLGDKVHVHRYYQGELLFDNNYYLWALAYILKKQLEEDGKHYFLVGYKKYSRVLLERLEELLGEKVVGTYIYSKQNEGSILLPEIKDIEIAIIVPIVSTLRTFDKVERFLDSNLKGRYNYSYFTFFVSRDGKIGQDVTKLEKSYNWKHITNEYIELQTEDKSDKIRVYYFMMLQGEWENALKCKMCDINNLDESPEAIIETGEDSLNLSVKLGIPYNSNPNGMECFTNNFDEKEIKKFYEEMSHFVIEGHFDRIESHFKHFLFCGKFFDEYLKANEKFQQWICQLKKEFSKETGFVNILLVPNYKINDSFCHFINEKVFNENTIIINEDFNDAFYSDFNKKYNYLKKLQRIRYIFLDNSMNTGNTWKKVYSLVSDLGAHKRFTVISLVNRLDYSNKVNVAMSGAKCYFFTEIYIPSIKEQKGNCWLCEEEIHLKKLCDDSFSGSMRRFYQEKKKKVKCHEIQEEDDEIFNKYRFKKHNTEINFRVTNEIYRQLFKNYEVLQEGNHIDFCECFGVNSKFEIVKNIVGNEVDYKYKIAFIKTMSRPFMNNFVGLRRFCVRVCVAEFNKLVKHTGMHDVGNQLNYMSVLLKRFGTLGCRFIINSDISAAIFEFYRARKKYSDQSNFLLHYAVAVKQLMLESEVNTLKFIQTFKEALLYMVTNENTDQTDFLKKLFYSHDIIADNALKNYELDDVNKIVLSSNRYLYFYQEMRCLGIDSSKMLPLLEAANFILECLEQKENENLGEKNFFKTIFGSSCITATYMYQGNYLKRDRKQICLRGRKLNYDCEENSIKDEEEQADFYSYLYKASSENKQMIGGTFAVVDDYIKIIKDTCFFHYSIGVSAKEIRGIVFECKASSSLKPQEVLAVYRMLSGIARHIIIEVFDSYRIDTEPLVRIKDQNEVKRLRGK